MTYRTVLNASGYLLAFVAPALLPLSAAAIALGAPPNLMAWFPLLFLFVLVPLLDWLIGTDAHNPAEADTPALEGLALYRALTWLVVPVWLALLAWAIYAGLHLPIDGIGRVGWLLSLGVVGGVTAINTAHELIHKTGRFEPALGGILLASVSYAGFKVEHLRGHHVHVSTPHDASSARYGQSLYGFLPQALISNARNAWRLEAQRLRQLGKPAWHWRNELILWYGLSAALALAFGLWLGIAAAAWFVAQGFIAGVTLEVINYIEHYGLERQALGPDRYERVSHLHSWNSGYRLTNRMLFQLQRHSDHHANARRRYQVLRHHEDSPQLPAGYATMFLLALAPPLWHRIVDPRVRAWRSQRAS